jgi:ubiquinone biosynthesis accessory factor UbiJ
MNTLSSSAHTTHTFAAGAACRGINHVLAAEPWAREQLAQHAHKTVLIQMPFGHLYFQIDTEGFLTAIQELESPSLALEITTDALGKLTTSLGNLREQAFKAVKITGDADLAQLIGRLASQVRWEYEEDLARVMGDAPANFAVRQGKKFLAASRSAVEDLLDNVVEYVSEEKKVLLNKRDFMLRKSELNDLRDSVDRLEKRIQLLEQKAK